MLTWRVVDDGLSGLIFDGYSATEILDHLSYDAAGKNKNNGGGNESDEIESEQGNKVVIEDIDDDENDDFVSFFDVGHVWDQCVVSDGDEDI
ncbi:hypothetical protein RJ641_007053 [Dillenia turbinata]|uniref:Uncharacterized protein n=1 Tax=Dillenia turbinata TaxID=194707 RepID=A0AAN8VFM1_9MAGN